MSMKYHCKDCGNERRFLMGMTLRAQGNTELYSRRSLAVQEPDGIYIIKGTEQDEFDRGPSGVANVAHLFCGKCKSNIHMDNTTVIGTEIKGYKGMEVLL